MKAELGCAWKSCESLASDPINYVVPSKILSNGPPKQGVGTAMQVRDKYRVFTVCDVILWRILFRKIIICSKRNHDHALKPTKTRTKMSLVLRLWRLTLRNFFASLLRSIIFFSRVLFKSITCKIFEVNDEFPVRTTTCMLVLAPCFVDVLFRKYFLNDPHT